MNTLSYKRNEVINKMFKFNLHQIDKLLNLINDINDKNDSKRENLAGIWKDSKFDLLKIEEELVELRKHSFTSLDNKIL